MAEFFKTAGQAIFDLELEFGATLHFVHPLHYLLAEMHGFGATIATRIFTNYITLLFVPALHSCLG